MNEEKENKPKEITLEEIKKIGLWEKISNIQREIKDLVKDETNKFQNYKYFEESQILKVLKPLLNKWRVGMVISDDDTQPFQHEREGTNHYLKYLKKMELFDLDNKSERQIFKFWACGSNTDLAKAKGSAETYAMKYILSKFFLIRVIDESDPDYIKPKIGNMLGLRRETAEETRKRLQVNQTQGSFSSRGGEINK